MSAKLKFRIVHCASEDPEFPVTELLTHSPHTKGWQSVKFCDYPQEMTLQFTGIVKLRQIQFLSHQSKISKRVELFTYAPKHEQDIDESEIKYKRLGYLSLDSNEKSNFQARELKSVYVDAPALYLKLVFHECFVNNYNLFSQIGLIAVNCIGDHMGSPNYNVKTSALGGRIEDDFQYDPTTADRLKLLEKAKQKAVELEDFDEAKKMKDAMDRLKAVGQQLLQLEQRKNIAIQNEQYDTAKILKNEIERLRSTAASNHLGLGKYEGGMPPVSKVSHRDFRGAEKDPMIGGNSHVAFKPDKNDMSRYVENDYPIGKGYQNVDVGRPQGGFGGGTGPTNATAGAGGVVSHDDMPIKPSKFEEKKLFEPLKEDPVKVMPRKKKELNEEDIFGKKDPVGGVGNDEEVLPAVRNKQGGNPDPEEEDPYQRTADDLEPESLSPEMQKVADPIIPIFGSDIVQRAFSKNWNLREDGLRRAEEEVTMGSSSRLLGSHDETTIFESGLVLVDQTVGDKISQVVIKSMGLLKTLASALRAENMGSKSENNLNSIIRTMTDKLSEGNVRVREAVDNAFMAIARSESIGPNMCVNYLTKPPQSKSKAANSVKALTARLSVLNKFVDEFQINNSDVPFTPVVEYAVKQFQNANGEVRNGAFDLMIAICRCVGDAKIRPYLTSLRPAQQQMLDDGFREAQGGRGGGAPKHDSKSEQKTIISTNINPHGAKNKKAGGGAGGAGAGAGAASKKKSSLPLDQVPTCQYCGRMDPAFENNDNLDIHLWRECPMLTFCQSCNLVIEVSELNDHYLKECEFKKEYKPCPRCKEAIHEREFDQHTEENLCNIGKPKTKANRCSLCHQDIAPGKAGWEQHLLQDGCPNNDRVS